MKHIITLVITLSSFSIISVWSIPLSKSPPFVQSKVITRQKEKKKKINKNQGEIFSTPFHPELFFITLYDKTTFLEILLQF